MYVYVYYKCKNNYIIFFDTFQVDYTRFNNTYEVDTPLCSAKQLDELRATVSTSQKLGKCSCFLLKTKLFPTDRHNSLGY